MADRIRNGLIAVAMVVSGSCFGFMAYLWAMM